MKQFFFILLCIAIVIDLSAQGITKHGQSKNTSTDFVNKHGKTGNYSELNKYGQVLKLATLTSTAVTSITLTTAMSGGNISDNGGAQILIRGVCWSLSPNPKISDNKTEDGSGTGTYTSLIIGLVSGRTYYVRAYAISSAGTSYGNEINFTTNITDIEGNIYKTIKIGSQVWIAENLKTEKYNDNNPIPLTNRSEYLTTPAYCWYNYDSDTYKETYGALYNGYAVNTGKLCPLGWHIPSDEEWNVLINYLGGEAIAGAKLKETGITHWASPNTGATNETGFTGIPGGSRNIYYEFSGLSYSSNFWSSTDYASTAAWYRNLTYDNINVFRNSISKRNFVSVRCLKDQSLPSITTIELTNITTYTATCGGIISDDGCAEIIARGVCWSTSTNPTIADSKTQDGTGSLPFTSSITGLSPGNIYYVRAYATNSVGTAYGNEISFTTSIIDIDGNIYNVVRIGDQLWTKENLKTSKLSDGTSIPLVINENSWINMTTPAYSWYNNDEITYKNIYGALYNYYTVITNKLCPTGWHVPNDAEWKILEKYLGMSQASADSVGWRGTSEGSKLKESGISHWWDPNTGATNETGFTGLPGGFRDPGNGTFSSLGAIGMHWTSTGIDASKAWARYLGYTYSKINRHDIEQKYGISVRCIKD